MLGFNEMNDFCKIVRKPNKQQCLILKGYDSSEDLYTITIFSDEDIFGSEQVRVERKMSYSEESYVDLNFNKLKSYQDVLDMTGGKI